MCAFEPPGSNGSGTTAEKASCPAALAVDRLCWSRDGHLNRRGFADFHIYVRAPFGVVSGSEFQIFVPTGCGRGHLSVRPSRTVGASLLIFTYVRAPWGLVSGPEFQIFVPTGCRTGQLLARQSVTV